MKIFLSLILVLLHFSACSDNPGIVELSDAGVNSAFLTTSENIDNQISFERIVNGVEGGEINFELDCLVSKAKGMLEIPELSFPDEKQILINIPKTDNSLAVLDFNPTDLFLDKPIFLTLKFSGLNFTKGEKIDFKCVSKDGEICDVDYGRLIIDYDNNWALVINAKIYEFSRVGFTTNLN